MTEGKKSHLYKLEPIIKKWPAVVKPEGHVHFRTKLLWTTGILLIYFALGNISVWGLSPGTVDIFAQFRAILAGQSGSIIHLGIGPIVTGGIILQLFVGAKIINLNLKEAEDKAIYQGTQKILVFSMLFIEGVPQVFGFLEPSSGLINMAGTGWARTIIVMQLAVGGYLIFLMDEVVSKWGIGSGVSLFIVGGIAQSIFTGLFSWIPTTDPGGLVTDPCSGVTGAGNDNAPGGLIPKTICYVKQLSTAQLVYQGGFEQIAFVGTNSLVALISTVLVFIVVVFAEGTRVELPLSHARVRGARGRYPIRLIYANVLPLIFVQALLANINLLGILLWSGPLSGLPGIGGKAWVGSYPFLTGASAQSAGFGGATTAYSGIAYYTTPVNGISDWLLPIISPNTAFAANGFDLLVFRAEWQLWLHILVYAVAVITGSIIFAIFWVETASMGPKDVAKQIQGSGMQLPGFRRDPRVLEKVLERYIPTVTIISGFAIGALSVFADMFGTIGAASGTGLLLAIGILSRLYEQLAKEQMMEMHPMIRGLFGEG